MKIDSRRAFVFTPLITKGILLMNLSLFFMLAAFFIALNGLSLVNNHRYQSIATSVADAFSVELVMQGTGEGFSGAPSFERSYLEGETLTRINGLFNAQITGFKTDTSRNGVMHVSVPLEELDRALRTANQVDLTKVKNVSGLQTYFMPTLVSFLKPKPEEQAYRMEIILHSRDNPSLLYNSDPAMLKAISAQASSYAALLSKAAMDTARLTVGIAKGEPAQADIYFRPYNSAGVREAAP